MMLAESAAQLGDVPALRRYAAMLESLAAQDDHRPYQAIAHRAWGIACRLEGEHTEAEMRLNQALELFETLEAPWQIGRTLCEMAELDLARSDPTAARDHFSRALRQFETMGAKPDIERTQAALAALD